MFAPAALIVSGSSPEKYPPTDWRAYRMAMRPPGQGKDRTRAKARLTLLAALSGLLALAGGCTSREDSTHRPARLDLTTRVDKATEENGALAILVPNYLSEADFRAGIDGKSERLPVVARVATLTCPISFIHFDTPGKAYHYRFVRADGGALAAGEQQIGVAGEGSLYRVLPGLGPVTAPTSLDHYIAGRRLSRGDALGLESSLLDFTLSPSDCTATRGIRRCCVPADQVERALARIRAGDEKPSGRS